MKFKLLPTLIASVTLGLSSLLSPLYAQDEPRQPESIHQSISEGVLQAVQQRFEQKLSTLLNLPEDQLSFENTFAVEDTLQREIIELRGIAMTRRMLQGDEESTLLCDRLAAINREMNHAIVSPELYTQLKKAASRFDQNSLSPVQKRYIELCLTVMHLHGADLAPAEREKLVTLRKELQELNLSFISELENLKQVTLVSFDSPQDLEGLPMPMINDMRREEEGKVRYDISYQAQSFMPMLYNCRQESTRKAIYEAWKTGGKDATIMSIIERILKLSQEKAELLGHKNTSDGLLWQNILNTGQDVEQYVDAQLNKMRPAQEADYQGILNLASRSLGREIDILEPWNAPYFTAHYKMMKQKRSMQLNYYLDFEGTLQRWHELLGMLYKIEITEKPTHLTSTEPQNEGSMEVWHESVRVFEITDKVEKKVLGSFYLDPFTRAEKSNATCCFFMWDNFGGAQATSVISLQFTPTQAGKANFLSHDDLTCMMHEYGHMLQNTFTKSDFWQLGAAGLVMDMSELSSTIHEFMSYSPEVLEQLCHSKSGNIPNRAALEQITQVCRDQHHESQYQILLMAKLDIALHRHYKDKFEGRDLHEAAHEVLAPWQIPTTAPMILQVPYTIHVFGGGYASMLYTYPFTAQLSEELYQCFENEGVLNPRVADRLRRSILEKGDNVPARELIEQFLGHPSTIIPTH